MVEKNRFSGCFHKPLNVNCLHYLRFPGVANSQKSRRRYGAIALPLRCNRVAVTVQSRCRYGVIALPLRCNGDAIWLLWQQKLAENALKALPRGASEPFFRSKSTCFQVLNFGNNILQFIAVSPFPALSFDCHSGCGWPLTIPTRSSALHQLHPTTALQGRYVQSAKPASLINQPRWYSLNKQFE